MATETKTTKPSSRLAVNVTDAQVIEKFNQLKGDSKSNPEFIAELLEVYEVMMGKGCSQERDVKLLKNMLTLSQDDKKSTQEEKEEKRDKKEQKLREIFELDVSDPLSVNECEIIEAASRVSGKSVLDMCIEGRLLIAKNEIGKAASEGGAKGKADSRILETYKFIKQSGQKPTLNRLTQLSGSNRKTVESWCERNNITFE